MKGRDMDGDAILPELREQLQHRKELRATKIILREEVPEELTRSIERLERSITSIEAGRAVYQPMPKDEDGELSPEDRSLIEELKLFDRRHEGEPPPDRS